ncbi:T9SS type A sorting domain-containing protein [uncultured Tenacibaculum sp.]|uniref:T9SS type A sorting domain-containing protein n=1 Tax=uncultured Tenacibaculum sp. TaxID=174713 RepID=UPI002609FAE6|nr:T9SS type A sorting domain-containing protein [uncultured Tenacibaculum sp.]
MKQKLLSVFTLLSISLSGQSIERSVTAASGGSLSNGTAEIDFTIGQLVSGTIENSNIILTQGFQQSRSSSSVPTIELSASSDGTTVITTIGYRNTATLGLDPGFDVGNFGGASFDVYTHLVDGSSTSDFTYQSLPDSNYETMVVPVGLQANSGKEVEFSANNSNLPAGLQVVIEDRTLNIFTILDGVSTYTVQLTSNESGIGRFYLHTRPEEVWDGSTGSVWSESTNWSTDITPLVTSNVRIPNVANSPAITATVIEANNVTIESAATLDINADGGITINGNFDNSGAVAIASSATTSGTFIVKGIASGSVTFERTGLQANKWSLITAPVSGQSVKEFVENVNNDIRVNLTVTPNRYAVAYYDDTRAAGSKWVYYTADDLTTNAITFQKGQSYIVSRGTDGAVSFKGTVSTSDETISVNADQWNAVGNPYIAYLPVNNNVNVNFIQENLNKFDPVNVGVYVWDNAQNKYVAKGLIDAATSLTVGQGFFMRAKTGETSITFKESQRLHDASEVQVFSRGTETPVITVLATQNNVQVDTKIRFSNSTSKGLDPGYDLGNFASANFDVFTRLLEDDKENDFTIQSLPESEISTAIIPVGITSETNQTIKISAKATNLPTNSGVYLEDKVTGDFTALHNGAEYTFKTTEKLNGIGRFYIHTAERVLTVDDELVNNEVINIFKSGKQEITIVGITTKQAVKVQLFSILGSEVHSETVQGNNTITITPNTMGTGVYIVRVGVDGKEVNKKIIID